MNDRPVAAGKSSLDLIDIDRTFAVFDLKPGMVFLDLACGAGRYSLEAARRHGDGLRIHAVDLWHDGIEQLKTEIAARGFTGIIPLRADIRKDIALENASIDSCLLATILHDLSQRERVAVIRQTVRLLKPGGDLNIIEFKKIACGPGPPLAIRLDAEDIDDLLSAFGFVKTTEIDAGEFTYQLKYRLEGRPQAGAAVFS